MTCRIGGWLTMVFAAYAFLLTVRLHFNYSMMVMMAHPLAPADQEPCADAAAADGQAGVNCTVAVDRRLRWTSQQQAAAVGAYFFGTLVSAFPVGVYSSMGHERSILLWCVLVTAVTVVLVPVASVRYDCWPAVAVLRFLQGCAFGPSGPCGATLSAKIVPKLRSSLFSTFMFSGTVFGGFTGNLFSGEFMPRLSHDGSYYALSALGFAWAAVWKTMVLRAPYERATDVDNATGTKFLATPWGVMLRSWPFVGLLVASFGYGHLYSFITTGLPIYGAKVLGIDVMENGIHVSSNWLICWFTTVLSGLAVMSFTGEGDTIDDDRTTVMKVYASVVLIGSPLMLLGVTLSGCNVSTAKVFMRMSVVLLGFERSSLRVNSMDLCPRYAGCLIALCDVFFSLGNITDSMLARFLLARSVDWNLSFSVAVVLPMACSVLFIRFGSSRKQCWDQRYQRPLT